MLVRPHTAGDIGFIFDSYLKSWRVSKFAGTIPNHLYFEVQRTLLEDLLGRGAKVMVVHPQGKEDKILGWACGEVKEGKCVLHYLYLKDTDHPGDVAELLLEALPGTKPGYITHKTFLISGWIHAPEMARRKHL